MRMFAPLAPVSYRDASEGFPTEVTWTFYTPYDLSKSSFFVPDTVYTTPDVDYCHNTLGKCWVLHTAQNEEGYTWVDDSVQVQFQGLVSNFTPKDGYQTNFTDGDLTLPGANKMGITAWAERFSKPSVPVVLEGMYVNFTKAAPGDDLMNQIASVDFSLYTSENGLPGDPIALLDSWTMTELNYAMTTTATGGFAIHNESTEYFHSPTIDYISITFQFLSGINFTLLYLSIVKMRLKALLTNSEFKLYVSVVIGATLWIMYLLLTRMGYDLEHAFRAALFQVVSFITTTGMFNEDAGTWPHITWVILGVVMYLGACAGSTSGGFKCIRGVMLLKVVRNNFRQILHPNAVLPVKINGMSIPQSKLVALFAFFTLTILMTLVTATIMIVAGIDNTNAITIALSCVSNVGPTLGTQIGPVMSWSTLPEYIKWILCPLMLMGRLEIMTVLVLFTRTFWKEN
jgi:hypothetical protein